MLPAARVHGSLNSDGTVAFDPAAPAQIAGVDGGVRPFWGGSGGAPLVLGVRLSSTQPLAEDLHLLGIRLVIHPAA